MKKLITHSTKLFLMLMLVFTIDSCKKESSISNLSLAKNPNDKLINDAKSAFDNQIGSVQSYQLLSQNSKKAIRHGLGKQPDWSNASIKK